ncbi:hypothetical protein GUITHDRAFT_152026 [Guillardia theta CCMP2712]|uniref:FHA domain-containing protein n=1 Tax=Guillardia theta (strain CCMP2712) TaxID=905079 RepID=L1JHD8_GUITC|nr:hypothetical protein GUITHDRAFT_152026 [Guillardia theta CCMP2712]EKX47554.1 hypothetical protein GUITHDRAFT_152026 [Guillardia theta CCMP2712]|eukprot:XP_005834534.1 hypothetical protein GUITHDRAFT_152026 [Guillardia theta CCMP2712]
MERDHSGNPRRIEVTLGRSPPQGQEGAGAFRANFHIGQKMKISKMHASLYWNSDDEKFYIKSICKNAVKVDGVIYPGSPDGNSGKPAPLQRQSKIEIADGVPIYFLLPLSMNC